MTRACGKCLRLVLVSLAMVTASHAFSSAALSVHVVDGSGLPIEKARVSLRSALGGQTAASMTDGSGSAAFAPPANGRYSLVAQRDGFAETSRFVEWRSEEVKIEIRLEVSAIQERITVTSGSRLEELQEDSPVKVEAVTRERMESTGYERVSDVLSEIPGVVTRSGSSGSVAAEQIRGVGARQVAVAP